MAGKSPIDANVNTLLFRKNQPMVIAVRRDLAQLDPVDLALDATGYLHGQVLARNSVDGLFYKFSASLPAAQGGGAVSGTYAATCVLFEDISGSDQPATGGALARGIFGGYVYTAQLLDYNATAKTQLLARDFIDATNTQITKF